MTPTLQRIACLLLLLNLWSSLTSQADSPLQFDEQLSFSFFQGAGRYIIDPEGNWELETVMAMDKGASFQPFVVKQLPPTEAPSAIWLYFPLYYTGDMLSQTAVSLLYAY